MKRFRLYIECDNSAFGDGPEYEIASILRQVAFNVEHGACYDYDKHRSLFDSNGNPVGTYRLKDEDDEN